MKNCFLVLTFIFCFSVPVFAYEAAAPTKQINSIAPLLSHRHSGRSYDSSRAVSSEQIQLLAEAARSAPSSYNEQPWNFIICDRKSNEQAYAKVFNSLIEFNQNWAKNAPVLIVVCANTQSSKTMGPNRWAMYDTGAAAICMALEASDLGLMAHQMGGFDEGKIRREFNIPQDYMPMSVMAVGYESVEEASLIQVKERRPLNENFFLGSWGKGLEVKN